MGEFLVLDWVTGTPINEGEKVVCVAVTYDMEEWDMVESAVSEYTADDERLALLRDIEIGIGKYNMYGWILDEDGGYELSRPDELNGKVVNHHTGLRYIAWEVFKVLATAYSPFGSGKKTLKSMEKEDILKILVQFSKEAEP